MFPLIAKEEGVELVVFLLTATSAGITSFACPDSTWWRRNLYLYI